MVKLCAVTIPIKTTNPLNQSQGISFAGMRYRARIRREQRGLAALVFAQVARKLVAAMPRGLVITLTRLAPSNGIDDDSLPASCKSIRDGIADALGLKSDRTPLIDWRYAQRRGPAYAVEVLVALRAAVLPANDPGPANDTIPCGAPPEIAVSGCKSSRRST